MDFFPQTYAIRENPIEVFFDKQLSGISYQKSGHQPTQLIH